MLVQLTIASGNAKTGPIPVSTTEENSCPNSCPMRGTDCYAKFGPLGMHWKQVSGGKRGGNWVLFLRAIERFPKGQLWRHNQAGDLPKGKPTKTGRDTIDVLALADLVAANNGRRGFTYTHYDPTLATNAKAIAEANSKGFTVNLSADDLKEADKFAKLGIAPVVVMLPADAPDRGNRTPAGLPIVTCPATTTAGEKAGVNCASCRLCQLRDRKTVIGFKAHGPAGKRLSGKIIQQNSK